MVELCQVSSLHSADMKRHVPPGWREKFTHESHSRTTLVRVYQSCSVNAGKQGGRAESANLMAWLGTNFICKVTFHLSCLSFIIWLDACVFQVVLAPRSMFYFILLYFVNSFQVCHGWYLYELEDNGYWCVAYTLNESINSRWLFIHILIYQKRPFCHRWRMAEWRNDMFLCLLSDCITFESVCVLTASRRPIFNLTWLCYRNS